VFDFFFPNMQNHAHITLSVFPLENYSSQKELNIFCRCISEDLITELSRFRQLSIIRCPNKNLSGNMDLTVPNKNGYYVQGTFRTEKDTVRINVQLYDSENQRLVWGNRFEGPITKMGDLQENLVRGVVTGLQQQIHLDLLSKIKKRPKVAFSAYEHWLYGMEELKKATLEADLKARGFFEKALEIQPDFALALTGMSLSYFNEWTCQLWDRWNVSKTGAYEWAQKAVEEDEQNHVIAMVLGRIFLYEGSYSTAEYYFRRSLMLNSNDPDTLFPISLYLVYLGLSKEALECYERGLALYPFYGGNHLRLGGFIYFELGDYEKAASFIEHNQIGKAMIADTDAYCAAIYFHLGQYEKMEDYWEAFLGVYRRLISNGQPFEQQEAIDWLLKLNPHRYKTHLEEFLKFISKGSFDKYPVQHISRENTRDQESCYIKENDIWRISYDGSTIQIPEVKGFYDIQKMLMQPRQLYHCAELMGSTLEDSGEKVIDEKARRQYQKKILELQSDIEEAEQYSNFERIEKLHEEYDKLVDHLSQSLNLKGKIRETGGAIEKARSAVTWRIRNAIAKIELYHPLLGTHLSNAIKTGTFCSYKPDRNIVWITS
jgi:TolB-like protein